MSPQRSTPDTAQESATVTRLLAGWRAGDERALADLWPIVYRELRRGADRCMRGERSDHTLQATALVHEAFERLIEADVDWRSRGHFYSVAARAMRRILVDHARARGRDKRGSEHERVDFDEAELVAHAASADVLALDEALGALAQIDERKSRLIELHFFCGLGYEELERALGISQATVHRNLRLAKAWLASHLQAAGH
ncbi:MAG: ECF-type sigma factor [Gammaproteobacteria bacterium]